MTPERFRIVTWNVRYFGHAAGGLGSTRKSRRGIAAALADLDPAPDLVCLQEIESRSLRSRIGRPAGRPGETQLESFMAFLDGAWRERRGPLPYDAWYFPAHRYRLLDANLYTTGLAVLVHRERLAVLAQNSRSPESIAHYHLFPGASAKQNRICAHLALATPRGRRLHLFNTHVSLPTPFSRDFWEGTERMGHGGNQVEEVRKLASFVRKRAGGDPYLLCGDFNSPPGSPVYRALTAELRCTGAQAALGRDHPTAGFLLLRMHLDHLFSGGETEWIDLDGTHPFGRGPHHGLSDHTPLIGRFELRSPPPP